MAEQIDIIVNAVDAASANINKINASLGKTAGATSSAGSAVTSFNSALMIAERALGYAKKAFDATVLSTVAYANQVRELGQVNGETAESNSRLIQLTDDYKISVQDLLTSQRELTKDGTVMTTGFLADVADKYANATTQAEKNKVAQDALGRSWRSYVELLQKGGDVIRKQSDAVEESLILTDEALVSAREYEIATDNLTDAWHGFTTTVGVEVLPVITSLIDGINEGIDANNTYKQDLEEVIRLHGDNGRKMNDLLVYALQQRRRTMEAAEAIEAHGAALDGDTASITDNADATAELNDEIADQTKEYKELISSIKSVSDNETDYRDAVIEVTNDTSLSVDERKAKLAELAGEYKKKTAEIVSEMLMQKMMVDGELSDAEFEMYLSFQTATGIIDENAKKQALSFMAVANAVMEGKLEVENMKGAIDRLQDKTITVTLNEIINQYSDRRGIIPSGSIVGPRAEGGAVTAGNSYLVGERGAEIFTPNQTGAIVPNGSGGNITLNVNVTGGIISDPQEVGRQMIPALRYALRQMGMAA